MTGLMDGMVNVLKPPGMTSHDVVNYIRRLTGIKRVGHTGTLDPGASGVLLVCCGSATRLAEYLPSNKQYRAEITFGIVSSTGDSSGKMIYRGILGDFTKGLVEKTLESFTGEIDQVPPMTSAVRFHGKKLYELARQGKVVEREARKVSIDTLELVRWYDHSDNPRALIDISCSAGTYIRTLCEDIGERLGCGAFMSFLLRTGVGSYLISEASTLEELKTLAERDRFSEAVVSKEEMLSFYPVLEVDAGAIKAVKSGAPLYPPGVQTMTNGIRLGDKVVLAGNGKVLAVAITVADDNGRLFFKPEKVLA